LQVINSNAFGIETFVKVSELLVMRREYAQEITAQTLIELSSMIVARRWGLFKQALLLKGYYSDLETLMET
jgi:hypothetical protein